MNCAGLIWLWMINMAVDDKWRAVVNLGKETSGILQGGEFFSHPFTNLIGFRHVPCFEVLSVKCRLNN